MVTWCINWRRLLALIFFQRSLLKWFPIIKRLAITLIHCKTACLVVNPITVGNFAFPLIALRLVVLQNLWWFHLSIDEMVGARCFGCCQAHWGLPVGFLLLQYSVLCTVESLSSLYLLFISWFICSGRWCMDKLGVLHANQTSMCLDPHLD